MEENLLKTAILWLLSGGGAGVATYFLMDEVPALTKLTPKLKRFISLALAAVIAMLAFCAGVALNYVPTPADAQAWIEQLFTAGGLAMGLSQSIHGARDL